MAREKLSFVYFIRGADGVGPVKIGCSTVPEKRLASFMAWSPYPLVIAARIPGGLALEGRFHARFAAQHSHREWFAPSRELDAVIQQIGSGVFDISSLPAAKRAPRASPTPCPRATMSAHVAALIAECEARDLSMDEVVKRAGIHRTVWHRWKIGAFAPSARHLEAVNAAISEMARAKAA